ncbi:MAG: TetR family transcriptional regulator [Actinobacteria bacterium]|nr:TetR family transcriptional regulator [Actinomycetota bacterium]
MEVHGGQHVGDQGDPESDEGCKHKQFEHMHMLPTYWSVGRDSSDIVRIPVTNAGEQVSTREVIIVEALHCFAEAGYEGTSLNDIAAAVGIRRPSLLHHFPSKEALYGEVFERVLSDFIGPIEEAAAPDSSGWERVETVLVTALLLFSAHPDHVRLLRREAIDGGAHLGIDLAAALRPMFDGAASFLDGEMTAGRFRRHDSRQLLITGYGALLGSFSDAPILEGLVDGNPMDEAAVLRRVEHIVGFFRAALVP